MTPQPERSRQLHDAVLSLLPLIQGDDAGIQYTRLNASRLGLVFKDRTQINYILGVRERLKRFNDTPARRRQRFIFNRRDKLGITSQMY